MGSSFPSLLKKSTPKMGTDMSDTTKLCLNVLAPNENEICFLPNVSIKVLSAAVRVYPFEQ